MIYKTTDQLTSVRSSQLVLSWKRPPTFSFFALFHVTVNCARPASDRDTLKEDLYIHIKEKGKIRDQNPRSQLSAKHGTEF